VKITQERVDRIIEIMFDVYGIGADDTFQPNYSGRGMCGKTCVGFIVSPREQAALGGAITQAFADVDRDDGEEYGLDVRMLTNVYVDSMAFDIIVYFPGVQLAE
jgi:hypothetical protein